ncbi:unnamed protein product [Brassicogethes aeneus]|uniref:Uncharacterized protein n=1 Tax=Brassicogethes aeneus TaxID=1431903 RepID=A0A9P0FGE0_BRAAE|nr:unnamed protein product [Brassicogethes aeneus]
MTPQCTTATYYNTKEPLISQLGANNVSVVNSKQKNKKLVKDKGKNIKCVIVGDRCVGKTALAVSYSNDTFPRKYIPTVYDKYNVEVQVNGEPIKVEICDTAGEDARFPLTKLCYPDTDVFLLCFSVVQPESFYSACTRWHDELTRLGTAVVLVGTQADQAQDFEVLQHLQRHRQRPVMTVEAQILAEKLNAPYVETSAKTCAQLKEAFDLAITLAMSKQKKRKFWRRLCCV